MLDPNEVADLRAFLDEMATNADEDYHAAMEHACDDCLRCDHFVFEEGDHGWVVQCRITDVPTTCGGPYQRISKAG